MQLSITSSALLLVALQLVQPGMAMPLSSRGVAGATAGDILKGPVLSGAKGGASAANAADPSILQSAEDTITGVLPRSRRSVAGATAGDILKGPVLSGAKGGASAANAADPSILQSAEDTITGALPRDIHARQPQIAGIAGAATDLAGLAKSAVGAARGGSSADQSVAKGTEKQADTSQQGGVDGIEIATRDPQIAGIAGAATDLAGLAKSAVGAARGGSSADQSVAKGTEKQADTSQQGGVDGIEIATREPQIAGIAGAATDLAGLAKSAVGAARGGSSADQSVAKGTEKQADTSQQGGVDGIEIATREEGY